MHNQHLFISSLAQYYPDDPDDPEYAERERNYYKFRRGLEKRYPQVCAECEPKVHEQLNKAAYTAKTDHLRRMLDRSARTRVLLTTSPGHYWHKLGKWLWTMSLLLQLLWHILRIHQTVISNSDDFDPKSWTMLATRTFALFAGSIPTPYRIMYWSFWTSLLSIWWNPRWIETYNGFTKHLVGISQFYGYEAFILILKIPGWFDIPVLPAASASRVTVQVIAHIFMATFMYFLYTKARRSIRTDHTPLWLPKPSSIGATPSTPAPVQRPETRGGGEQSMADILDEILNDPPPKPVLDPTPLISKFATPDHFDHMPPIGQRSSYNPSARLVGTNPFRELDTARQAPTTGYGLDSLSIEARPRPRTRAQVRESQAIQYETEMDWSPTKSQHRAFNTPQPGQSRNLKFNETPVQERHGAFWAKVPPAPTTPAQRIFNPSNAPIIRNNPIAPTNKIQFQGSSANLSFSQAPGAPNPGTTFANPSFFPRPPRDERDTLSGLLDKSLTLGPSHNEHDRDRPAGAQRQTILSTIMYIVLGVCLAVLANRAYDYFF